VVEVEGVVEVEVVAGAVDRRFRKCVISTLLSSP
jgi:hypothetical protein